MEDTAFLEDIYPRHLLYAVTIRSPIANGYLKLIQCPVLPENYVLITAKNIPGENRLADTQMPILADKKLSYIGEPVALLLGPSKTMLEELLKQCKILVDAEDSEDGAETLAAERKIQIGSEQSVYDYPGKIVSGSYSTGIQDHWYAEPLGAVTWYKNDTLIVKTATQWAYHVKRSTARALGIDEQLVFVEPTSLSLHMDGKLLFPSFIACHAALGSFVTKKPVRLILNREEDFLFSPKRYKADIDITSNIDENGNITASEIEISVNLGAHKVNAQELLDHVCIGCIGFYQQDNLKINAKAYMTNLPPQGPFSGFGLAQGFFAIERHLSQIADTLNKDLVEWRKERSGLLKTNAPHSQLIDTAAAISDYNRKWASYELLRVSRKGKATREKGELRGIGMAFSFQESGLLYYGEDKGKYGVEVTLTKEGFLEIKAAVTSSDGDYGKIWAKIASGILSIEPDMVRLITNQAPDCGPSCASRNIAVVTKLVEKCCVAIRKKRFHDPLPITVRRSVRPQSGSLFNGVFTAPAGKVLDTNAFSKPGMAAAVVETSIDLIDCIPKIRGVWLAVDGGRIISKNRAKRNLTRAVSSAFGWAFKEKIKYVDGAISKNNYENFSIFSGIDVPQISIEFLNADSGDPKGIGDLPFSCIPAAFLQAVSQAMDYCYKSIPLDRKEIFEITRIKNNETQAVK